MAHQWKSTRLTSLEETFKVLADLRGRLWLCRGQAKCYGALLPSIDRGPLEGLSRLQKLTLERQSLDLFRANVRFFSDPGEEAALTNDNPWTHGTASQRSSYATAGLVPVLSCSRVLRRIRP